MKSLLILGLFLTLTATPYAAGQDAHVHGVASGSIIIDKNDIFIEVTIPGASVTGFEYKPVLEEDKQRVNDMKERLNQISLFNFYEPKTWFVKNKMIPHPSIKKTVDIHYTNHSETHDKHDVHDKHDKHEVHDNHEEVNESHSTFTMTQHYKRIPGKRIESIETTLFSTLPNLDKVELRIILHDKQFYYELSPQKSKINIKGK